MHYEPYAMFYEMDTNNKKTKEMFERDQHTALYHFNCTPQRFWYWWKPKKKYVVLKVFDYKEPDGNIEQFSLLFDIVIKRKDI